MGLGGPEMAFLFILLLLLFGVNKLPELARGMGKSLGEFKEAQKEFEETLQEQDSVRLPRGGLVRTIETGHGIWLG
jgi:sec-independent protein translocase protein TatA